MTKALKYKSIKGERSTCFNLFSFKHPYQYRLKLKPKHQTPKLASILKSHPITQPNQTSKLPALLHLSPASHPKPQSPTFPSFAKANSNPKINGRISEPNLLLPNPQKQRRSASRASLFLPLQRIAQDDFIRLHHPLNRKANHIQ